jgi:DNA adenine methylase
VRGEWVHFVTLFAPFPYHGGKRRIAAEVWRRFGRVKNYVEPFFGSGAVLLARPDGPPWGVETVNDKDALLCNLWRSIQRMPEETAFHADYPVVEGDLHPRHRELVARRAEVAAKLAADPRWCDPELGGWWLWGVCLWIGAGWCADPHQARDGSGERLETKRPRLSRPGAGILKAAPRVQLPAVGDPGRGIHAPTVGGKKKPCTGSKGRGIFGGHRQIDERLIALAERLRAVRVCSGDWARVLGRSTLGIDTAHGMSPTGILLDAPYDHEVREGQLYAEDSTSLSREVRQWALEHGNHPSLRIAICGYEEEHTAAMPSSWTMFSWKSQSGYASADRERVWFSPHCLGGHASEPLFEHAAKDCMFTPATAPEKAHHDL